MSLAFLIAQVEAPPSDFSGWLANAAYGVGLLGAVLWCWTLIRDLRAKKEETPQPFVVAEHSAPVAKPDFDKAIKEAHGRMNREKVERDAELLAMRDATDALREKVEKEVDAMRRLVEAREASGEARANRINDRIDVLSKAVAEMPDRLFALIRNAKNL